MSTRSAIYAAAIVVLLVGLLLLRGSISDIPQGKTNLFIEPNSVEGIEVVYKQQAYTLNFEQQNEFVDTMNRMLPIGKLRDTPIPPPHLDKIVVYPFNKKPIVLTPVSVQQNELIFTVPEWNPNGFLMDVSAGYMWNLVESSHDP